MSNIVLEVANPETVIDALVNEVILELTGLPGPAGDPGSPTFVQESEPTGGNTGDLWFNPVTGVLKIYSAGIWVTEVNDDGFF